ncbi:MAG TPA: DEAD/DEAH box helicase [Thermoanaerobaculia bacterium]|nr:DEAD/DEAH box helicase [Thermoanaerobaculia bacterium]
MPRKRRSSEVLDLFHSPVREWFASSFPAPTEAQNQGWPAIVRGDSTLIFAPTGSGKTLTAFLWCIDQLMFAPVPEVAGRCRVIYVSPLKALAVDVERNLRSPLIGISHVAIAQGAHFHDPTISIRTGDTPARERSLFQRQPADILITTPESLYLLLTSNARESLRSVETVIIDEIHALVPTKRGVHLALSLERLDAICRRAPQRIGLSATQRPLDEVAKFLGGADLRAATPAGAAPESSGPVDDALFTAVGTTAYRPVTIIDTKERKELRIRVEVPVEEMARLAEAVEIPSGPASQGPTRSSIWPAIHPRLLELIRAHSSTLIFVNSRRLAERMAAALNELAGENLVNAHHGSLAREQRVTIEDALKLGKIKGLVATSSLELGIDMGAIDLVIQIEAPPSIASGMQRIGRGSHQVGTVSSGVIFPKYRGDLVACAAVTEAMHSGRIEATRYPRNPLDVLAQQIVAMVSMDDWDRDELFSRLRCAAPFAELNSRAFDGVLDMLSGLYPSDEFAELRPRLTWDRVGNRLTARGGSKRVAILNGGTIPDRGLYGVFLEGAQKGAARVGELDEEMVFECRQGETFLLGASTWRIEQILHDRVIVSPAPGQPGKMPFWHGDSAQRSVEFGAQIGRLVREIRSLPSGQATTRLARDHDLDSKAAGNLLQYLADQEGATVAVPDDQTIVVERCLDELGDWLLCVLTPMGGRLLAPWSMAVIARVRNELAIEVEAMWSDDGFIIRFPESDKPPDVSLMLPGPEEVEDLVLQQLGSSALFAARFRENAARALLLPRRFGGARTPLWQQRKRAYDLLQVASRFGSFPILLETYRECLRDIFDVQSLKQTMTSIENRTIRVVTADTDRPSPFAGSLLFRYVANYIYDGDAPLAERRAQALAIDQSQLRELLGEAELRDLLDTDALDELEQRLQHLEDDYRAKTEDSLHDLLLNLGDLSVEEIRQRTVSAKIASSIQTLVKANRALATRLGGEKRFIAIEDAGRYRDGLGVPLPAGIPDVYLRNVDDPVADLFLRYARTHGPFTIKDITARFALSRSVAESILSTLAGRGKLAEGEFRPNGTQREWCHPEVLRMLRRRSLARLRREVEPVDQSTFARLLTSWQGVLKRRSGINALLDTIESLQGYPLPASILEREIFAARVEGYQPSDLDALAAAGEIVWCGLEPVGERDGRVAIFLADHFSRLRRLPSEEGMSERELQIVEFLRTRGASFFDAVQLGGGAGFPTETLEALWSLVWRGQVTNDSFQALRSYTRPADRKAHRGVTGFRSRRNAPRGGEGRWSLLETMVRPLTETERRSSLAHQLLARYGVVSREAVMYEALPGGFSGVYDVFKYLEEAGKIRRGFFVAGLAATQFAQPGAVDILRSLRDDPQKPETVLLAATDPANSYGSIFKWPETVAGRSMQRVVGASVILVNGALAAYLYRGEKQLLLFLPDEEPARSLVAREVARILAELVHTGARPAFLVTDVNAEAVADSKLAPFLLEQGFVSSTLGFQKRAVATAHA